MSHALVEGVKAHAIFMTDVGGRILTWNPGVGHILGYSREEWVGRDASIIFTPEDQAENALEHEMTKARAEGHAEDIRWHLRKDGTRFFADGFLTPIHGSSGDGLIGYSKVLRDATARKSADDSVREREEYLRRLVESSPDCIKTLDLDGRVLSMNEGGQQVMQVDDFSNICGLNWLTFWQDEQTKQAVRAALDAARAGGTGRFHGFCPTVAGEPRWWDVVVVPMLGADGTTAQLLAVSRDVTERVRVDEALARGQQKEHEFLKSVFMQAPAFMAALRAPNHIFEMANPPYYQLVGHRDIIGKPVHEALPEVVEQGFIGLLDHVYQTGEPFVGKNVPILLQTTPDGPLEQRFLDFSYQPLRDEDGAVTGILAHGIDLTERRRMEQERECLLSDAQASAEREAVLNQIGQAVRSTDDPEEVLARATALLGTKLGADRCFFTALEPARSLLHVGRDWQRAGLPPMTGEYPLTGYGAVVGDIFRGGRHTANIVDAQDGGNGLSDESREVLGRFGLRSQVAVASLGGSNGNVTSILTAAMAAEPREWTDAEVALVEAVATMTRTALELARVQRRERNIAQQLQAALQPPPPPDLPGLALQGFYRPALAEAGVGGDFFDVFPVEKGCSALVVGDLSGKGLAAAQQVATVRNMLRFALYTGRTVAEAVTTLHHALVEHDLLSGFATLFVGLYDHGQRSLTYVNCGQEPGLIWRAATGRVQQLEPTGPVLGGFIGGDFTETVANLAAGDVLALFTDGMTEVGKTRKEFLEVEGLAPLFARCCAYAAATADAESIKDRLIGAVEAHAGGMAGLRDDIALLVGVVAGSATLHGDNS